MTSLINLCGLQGLIWDDLLSACIFQERGSITEHNRKIKILNTFNREDKFMTYYTVTKELEIVKLHDKLHNYYIKWQNIKALYKHN